MEKWLLIFVPHWKALIHTLVHLSQTTWDGSKQERQKSHRKGHTAWLEECSWCLTLAVGEEGSKNVWMNGWVYQRAAFLPRWTHILSELYRAAPDSGQIPGLQKESVWVHGGPPAPHCSAKHIYCPASQVVKGFIQPCWKHSVHNASVSGGHLYSPHLTELSSTELESVVKGFVQGMSLFRLQITEILFPVHWLAKVHTFS